jgi:hypothetical protein
MPGEYRVIIENRTDDSGAPVSTAGTNTKQAAEGAPVSAQKSKSSDGMMADVMVATNVIKPYVQQVASFGISQIEMSTGSADLQRKAQAFSSLASSTISVVAATAAGGLAAGAAAAGVMLLQGAIQSQMNFVTIRNQKLLEDESIALRKSRIGLSINGSRGGGVV